VYARLARLTPYVRALARVVPSLVLATGVVIAYFGIREIYPPAALIFAGLAIVALVLDWARP
jgi:hypothetical protein